VYRRIFPPQFYFKALSLPPSPQKKEAKEGGGQKKEEIR